MNITSFSFSHTASNTEGCYSFEITRTENGTRLYAEELFYGGRIADRVTEADVLDELGELAGKYRVDRWDGFDKNKKPVRDGSSFTLTIVLADGSTISAHGNNAFPKNYPEVLSAIQKLYTELMEQYGEVPAAESAEGVGLS